ncbi:MAG TPA: hypothetical protein VF772_25545 [Terriglobales bacterium]
MDKRYITATVKLSKADLELLEKTAQEVWPGAIMTRSTMLLSLAKPATAAL